MTASGFPTVRACSFHRSGAAPWFALVGKKISSGSRTVQKVLNDHGCIVGGNQGAPACRRLDDRTAIIRGAGARRGRPADRRAAPRRPVGSAARPPPSPARSRPPPPAPPPLLPPARAAPPCPR